MAQLFRRLRMLAKLEHSAQIAAVEATLPLASEQETAALVSWLMDTPSLWAHPKALSSALLGWAQIGSEGRAILARRIGAALPRTIDAMLARTEPAYAAAAVQVLLDAMAGRSTEAAALLEESDLFRLAVAAAESGLPIAGDLAGLLERLISQTVHAQRPLHESLDRVLAAQARNATDRLNPDLARCIALASAPPQSALNTWFASEDEIGHMAVRSAARRLAHDECIPRLMAWLATPVLGPVALQKIEKLGRLSDWKVLFRSASLLSDERRRRQLRRATLAHRYFPQYADLRSLEQEDRIGALFWLEQLPMPIEQKSRRLAEFVEDAFVFIRLRAVHVLRGLEPKHCVLNALRTFADDDDVHVARFAAGGLAIHWSQHSESSAAGPDAPTATDDIGAEARRCRMRLALIDDLEVVPSDPARNGSRRIETTALQQLRQDVLHAPTRAQRLQAIARAGSIRNPRLLEIELLRCASDRDPQIVAGAIRALSHVDTPTCVEAIRRLTGHADIRIRANAIEALGKLDAGAGELVEHTDDSAARVRANAIRALLKHAPEALQPRQALGEMLTDPRADHRRAGLWIVERLADCWFSSRVVDLAEHDPDYEVRARASRCARRLLGEMRRGWRQPQQTVPSSSPEQASVRSEAAA